MPGRIDGCKGVGNRVGGKTRTGLLPCCHAGLDVDGLI